MEVMTGRPMKGLVMVRPDGFNEVELLKEWLEEAKGFATALFGK